MLFLAFIIFLILIFVLWRKWISCFSGISSPPKLPWLGTIPFLKRDPCYLYLQLQKFSKTYGSLYILWLCTHPLIVAGKPDFIREFFRNRDFLNKSSFYQFVHEWLGTGLLTSSTSKWKIRRKAISPSFHFFSLKTIFTIFKNHSLKFVKQLNDVAEKKKIIDIQELSSCLTLDIICEAAMGVQLNIQENGLNSQYLLAVQNISEKIEQRIKSPWLWNNFLYRYTELGRSYYNSLYFLHNFSYNVIKSRIQSQKKNKRQKGFVFLDMLLDLHNKGELDINGVKEEVDTFMFEGHDTTASALSWTLYLLGKHLLIQKKIQKEIDSIQINDDLYSSISNFKYLECVIKESLRMHPPVTVFSRQSDKETRIGNIKIPKGTSVMIDILAAHYDSEHWDKPNIFLPERFYNNNTKRHPFSFIPFSAGERNCIGQRFAMLELKVLLYFVIKNFEVEAMQEEYEIQKSMELIHKSKNGLLLKIYKRVKEI